MTLSENENENAVSRVQVWLNEIVEAFDDGRRSMPQITQRTVHLYPHDQSPMDDYVVYS
jgi:hypothetical protein